MTDVAWWIVAALALAAVELVTGTFYLLMVAIGCVAGAAAAAAGAAPPLQLVVGAAIGVVATTILRRTRWGVLRIAGERGDAVENRDVVLDIGEVVEVDAWDNGTAHVRYRGCRWDAALEPGASARTGSQVIKAVRGSTLIVAPAPIDA